MINITSFPHAKVCPTSIAILALAKPYQTTTPCCEMALLEIGKLLNLFSTDSTED